MQAPDLSARAVRRFRAAWALSWALKFAVLMAFLFLLIEITGGH